MKVILVLIAIVVSIRFSHSEDTLNLTLAQIYSRIRSSNFVLEGLREAIHSDSALIEAQRSTMIPGLDLVAGYTLIDQVQPFKAALIGSEGHAFMVTLRTRYDLFDGGRRRADLQSALAAHDISTHELEIETLDHLYAATLSYHQLQIRLRRIFILEKSHDRLDEQIRHARLLAQAGRISALEEQRLIVEKTDLESHIEASKSDYLSHSRTLNILMGMDTFAVIIPGDSLVTDTLLNLENPENEHFDGNPRQLRLEAQIRGIEASKELSRAARKPRVSAQGWYGYEFGTSGFGFSEHDRYSVGASLTVPLLNAREVSSRIGAADHRIRGIHLAIKQQKLQLQARAFDALTKIRELRRTIELRRSALQLATRNLRMANLEFQAGRRSATDIIDMNYRLLQTELSLAELYIEYNKAVAILRFVRGEME